MRVLHIMSSGGMYGAEKATLNLIHALPDIRFSALVFCRPDQDGPAFANALEKQGIAVTRMRAGLRHIPGALPGLLRLNQRPDLIHAHGYKEVVVGLLLARRWKTPLILTQHGFVDNSRKTRLYNRLDMFCCRLKGVSRVLCASAEILSRYRAARVAPAKLVLAPNAVPLRPLSSGKKSSAADSRIILYAGRLSKEKGVDVLLEAAALLGGRPFRLDIAGDGPLGPSLERRIRELGLTNKVFLLGFREDMSSLLGQADIFVLPSLSEGSPLALQEAMAEGLCCVAGAVGEIPSLLADGAGLLVPPGDPEALAEVLVGLLSAPGAELERMGTKARRVLRERGSLEARASVVRHVYEQALGERQC